MTLSREVASESIVVKRLLEGSFKEGDSSSVRSHNEGGTLQNREFKKLIDQAIESRKVGRA